MARLKYSDLLKQIYGTRVQKLNVNAGFTCPNRDGTLGWGGCSYCNNASFTPYFSQSSVSVTQQLLDGMEFYAGKYSEMKYLTYFQSFTGTYDAVERLAALYNEALLVPDVVGLVISTRPDCLSDEILNLLSDIDKHHKIIVEIGVETIHDRTLAFINRCHSWQCAKDAIKRVAKCGIVVGAHIILGLPGETIDDMIATVDAIAELPLSSVKFHQLQVLRGTHLAQQWQKGEVEIMDWTAQEYAALCRKISAHLPDYISIERMVSTAPEKLLLHPKWGLKPSQFKQIFDDF